MAIKLSCDMLRPFRKKAANTNRCWWFVPKRVADNANHMEKSVKSCMYHVQRACAGFCCVS